MLLNEHEGKRLLRDAGIPIPSGFIVPTAAALNRRKVKFPVALKAQVTAGGRGKAGGVVRAQTRAGMLSAARRILASHFSGERPSALLIEPWLDIERELYLSVTIDPTAEGYVVLYSPRGGVHIEAGAPPARYPVGAARRFRAHALREILFPVESDSAVRERVIALARRLVELASSRDCTTVEINPLARLRDGTLVAADAKIVRDEYAAYRQADIGAALEASRKRQPSLIARALAGDLMLVWLGGSVGLISGGAGMTMAAMDLIAEAGGAPACFLDCSNNPTPEGYRLSFELLDAEPRVKVILVSIFGGLTQMDRVARVMGDILGERRSRKPVVFRLNGTHAEKIDDIFSATGIVNHLNLEEAVAEAVRIARRKGSK